MKIETKDDLGRDIVIDIEPNGDGEEKHLYVTVAHYRDAFKTDIFEGRLFQGGASEFERTPVNAYGKKTTIGEILNAFAGAKESDTMDDIVRLFDGILADGLQSGRISVDSKTGAVSLSNIPK